jgi:predicted peptidase
MRLYLIGLSMGAFGVWDLLSRRPDCFAAAVSICGDHPSTPTKVNNQTPAHTAANQNKPQLFDLVRKASRSGVLL